MVLALLETEDAHCWERLLHGLRSRTVAPPPQYAVQGVNVPIAGNGSFTDYAPGLSIKTNNYILPYSLQILTLLLPLDDNL
jgi:hypothetical protein